MDFEVWNQNDLKLVIFFEGFNKLWIIHVVSNCLYNSPINGMAQNGMYSVQPKKKENNAWIIGADKKLKKRYRIVLFEFIFKTIGGNSTVINIGIG